MGNRSTDRLVTALEAAGAPAALVDKARANAFHIIACGQAGLRGIADAAKRGDFDATREESEAWMKSEDGQRTLAKLATGE